MEKQNDSNWQVMISSRMSNFAEERTAAHNAILAANMVPLEAEVRPPVGISSEDYCRQMAEECDLFLLILGPTYGYQPDGQEGGEKKSVTHLEYEWAKAKNKRKVLVFIREDALDTTDPYQYRFIQEVRDFSDGYNVPHTFKDSHELEKDVHAVLLAWQREHSLALQRFLINLAANYESFVNPITGEMMKTESMTLLQLRSETGKTRRLSWDEAIDDPELSLNRLLGRNQLDITSHDEEDSEVEEPEIDTAENFLQKYKRLVIIGDPGSGKTTLMHHLVHDFSQAALGASDGEMIHIPIYASAHDIARLQKNGTSIIAIIASILTDEGMNDAAAFASAEFHKGRFLLLIDGLDEISQSEQRKLLFTALHLVNTTTNYAVLTSRPSSYQVGDIQEWQLCEVQQLDRMRRRRLLISTLLQEMNYRTRSETIFNPLYLEQSLEQRADLRVWAGNPLLLTLITMQYSRDGLLPRERATIYRFAFEEMLDRNRAFMQRYFEKDVLEQALKALAFAMTSKGIVTASLHEIASLISLSGKHFDEERVIELIERSAVLQKQAPGRWGFIHLTFQEYLAAASLAEMEGEACKRLIYETRMNSRWEQVALLLVSELDRKGLTKRSTEVVEGFIQYDTKAPLGLYQRDPFHLSLIRATLCHLGRMDINRDPNTTNELQNKWRSIEENADKKAFRDERSEVSSTSPFSKSFREILGPSKYFQTLSRTLPSNPSFETFIIIVILLMFVGVQIVTNSGFFEQFRLIGYLSSLLPLFILSVRCLPFLLFLPSKFAYRAQGELARASLGIISNKKDLVTNYDNEPLTRDEEVNTTTLQPINHGQSASDSLQEAASNIEPNGQVILLHEPFLPTVQRTEHNTYVKTEVTDSLKEPESTEHTIMAKSTQPILPDAVMSPEDMKSVIAQLQAILAEAGQSSVPPPYQFLRNLSLFVCKS